MPYTQVKTFWGFPASEAGAQALDNNINGWLAVRPDIEVVHIGQSQSQAADHGSPRVTVSIFYKSARLASSPAAQLAQETLIASKPPPVKKGMEKQKPPL